MMVVTNIYSGYEVGFKLPNPINQFNGDTFQVG